MMNLLEMSVSGTVMIVAVILARVIALDTLPKRILPFLWGLVLARLMIPISLSAVIPVPIPPPLSIPLTAPQVQTADIFIPPDPVIQLSDPMPEDDIAYSPVVIPDTSPVRQATVPWFRIIWFTGMTVCALMFTLSYTRYRRMFRRSRRVDHPAALTWLQRHPTARHMEIRESENVVSPLTFGILRPVILMPSSVDWGDMPSSIDWEDMSSSIGRGDMPLSDGGEIHSALAFVLFHEYAHICHFDAVKKIILAATLCVHWFNPFVWLMYVFANRDLELYCDETVVRHFGLDSRFPYVTALLDMEERRAGMISPHFSANAAKERIRAIMKTQKMTPWTFLLSCVIVTAVIGFFAVSGPRTSAADTDGISVSGISTDYDTDIAAQLATIGIFRGTSAGLELNRVPTRAEAAIMLTRLYGVEESAQTAYNAGEISHPFHDVSAFTSPYVAWLYTNGIVNGVSPDTFGAQNACSLRNYVAFLLRVLGYRDGVDFEYTDALNFAAAHELNTDGLSGETFLRGDLAALTYRALAAVPKDGYTYLLNRLIADGAVTETEENYTLRGNIRALHMRNESGGDVEWLGHWGRYDHEKNADYFSLNDGTQYDTPPAYFPTWLPEDAVLSSISQFVARMGSVSWTFYTSENGRIHLSVSYPMGNNIGHGFQREETVPNKQTVMINGSPADFYREDGLYRDSTSAVLAWETDDGVFFMLDTMNIREETLFRIAESIVPQSGTASHYTLGRLPTGYLTTEGYRAWNSGGGLVNSADGGAFQWLYAPVPIHSPAGTPLSLTVNGAEAYFWSASDTYDYDGGELMVNGERVPVENGVPMELGGLSVMTGMIPTRGSSNVLSWRDTETGMYFQIWGSLSRTEMVRLAQNARKTA